MRHRALAAVLLAAALSPAAARGDEAADVHALLARVQKAYTARESFSLTFVQSYAPAGFPDTTPETGKLVLQAPDSIRFDYDGSDGKVFTFDGRAGRQYVAADKQMVVRTLAPEERERLPLLFLESPDLVLGRYAAALSPAAEGLSELTLTPRSGGDPKKLSLAVTREGDVKRLVILDGQGNRTTFTFTRKEPGKRRPASDFTLAPPKGTRIVGE